MIAILAAVVRRDAGVGQPGEPIHENVVGLLSGLAAEPGDEGEATEPIDQHDEGLVMAEAQGLAFPMADLGALIGRWRPGVDEQALSNGAGTASVTLTPRTLLLAPTQVLRLLLLASPLLEDRTPEAELREYIGALLDTIGY